MKLTSFFCGVVAIATCCFQHVAIANQDELPAAHVASPEHYEKQLDNEHVLVLKMTLEPGESDNWHSHRAETVYFEKGGSAIIRTESKEMSLDIPDGHVMWHDAWEHQVTNIGNSSIVAIIVEQKR